MTEHAAPAPAADDLNNLQLTVTLPVWAWIVIGNHLRRGAYDEVGAIAPELHRQLLAQLPGQQPAPTAATTNVAQPVAEQPPASTAGDPSSNQTKVVH